MSAPRYDLIIRNGTVVDPAHDVQGPMDIAIEKGNVVATGTDVSGDARQTIDASNHYVFPGLVDLHVHLSVEFNGHVGHRMLAAAGVTTALDVAGPIEEVLDLAARFGSGINVGCLVRLKPGERIDTSDPSRREIQKAIADAMAGGGLGVKMLGGHYPLSPEATGTVIEEANRAGAYVAFHCGTTASSSNLTGLREAIDLAGDHRLHVPHINSYCRGEIKPAVEEAMEAIALLEANPHLFSESYLAIINGTWASCVDGVPESDRTRTALRSGGYPVTAEGMRQAILDGYALIHGVQGGTTVLLSGPEAVAMWEAAGTKTGVSFPVNPPLPGVMLATHRLDGEQFSVDAFTTDGGGIPRNVTLQAGLALVDLHLISLKDFVRKAAWTPAQVVGLPRKGHLGLGADADLCIVDPAARKARTTIVGGQIVMHEGMFFGSGARFLTTDAGVEAVRRAELEPELIDLAESGFYTGRGLKEVRREKAS